MKTIQDHLNAKLLLSYFVVLLTCAVVLVVAVMFTAPGAYNHYMPMTTDGNQVNGSAMPGMGSGLGHGFNSGQGLGPGQGPGFNNFRAAVLQSLGYAVIVAILVAVFVSILLSRQIVSPLRVMMSATQRVADGRYDERVNVGGSDELAQLAQRFNRMAERLEQTETMRRQLIGDVSHELRTPLTAISGYMEGLVDGVLPASPETFEQVRMEAGRLSRLVDDLQELSRVEAGSYRLNIHPVRLSNLIETTVKKLSKQFVEKNVKLDWGSAASVSAFSALPEVLADEDRTTQVITNLLANALLYTPAGGVVSVSAVKNAAEVQISVKDNGIGISADNMDHIFDRFYRVDKSRSRAGGSGSGIGLTIAKAIVEAQNGRIWVESAGEGLGSTFNFTVSIYHGSR